MIVYKSMLSSSLSESKKPFPYRTGFNNKSLIVAGFSAVLLLVALLLT